MSAGTKVTVAIVVLFAAVLGIYYGFGGPGSTGLTPTEVLPPAEQDPDSAAVEPSISQDPTGAVAVGVIGQSIEETLWPQGGPTVTDDVRPQDAQNPEDLWVLRAPTLMPEPETQPVQAAGGARTVQYVVQEDDSLWTIAAHWFGDATRWQEIAETNPAINPDRLRVGQTLHLPSHQPEAGSVALNRAVAVPVPVDIGYYTVRSGDTLSTIAQTRYRNASRWREIYDSNRAAIGWDPDRLKVGMRLRMPAK